MEHIKLCLYYLILNTCFGFSGKQLKKKKNTNKDNLNITHWNNTPSYSSDLNFTKTAVVYAKSK